MSERNVELAKALLFASQRLSIIESYLHELISRFDLEPEALKLVQNALHEINGQADSGKNR